ncbi:MAG: cyclase family protein [Thermoactinomyces sp.]
MKIKKMVDLSQDLFHQCPVLPSFEPPHFSYDCIGPRDGWKLERVNMNLHQGTHMDAPAHLVDFDLTLDQYSVEQFQGRLVLVDCREKQPLSPILINDLEPYQEQLGSDAVVVLNTGWGQKRAWTKEYIFQSPYLSNEAARWLVDRRVRGVGIDHFSIGGTVPENEETHRILLGAKVWIAEGLEIDHDALAQGEWYLFAMPLKIRDSSGAPARVVAVQYE